MTWNIGKAMSSQVQLPANLSWFPRPYGRVNGYVFEGQGTQHLNFRGWGFTGDNSIYELWWDNGWGLRSINAVPGGPALPDGDPQGYAFEAQGTQHVNYRGVDLNIHELYWENQKDWQYVNVSERTGGAPAATGNPHCYPFEAQKTRHVVYRDAGGNIYELYWDNEWQHWHSLTSATGAQPAAGDPHGYVFDSQGTQHVVYRGSDGTIYELYWDGGWGVVNLTEKTGGAPAAAGDPFGYAFESQKTQHVVYRDTGGNICELYSDNGWKPWHYLPAGASSASDPEGFAFENQQTQHVYLQGQDKNVYQICWDNTSAWHSKNLIQTTGGPPPGESLQQINFETAYLFKKQGTLHAIYSINQLTYSDIYEMYWSPQELSSIRFVIETGGDDAGGGLHGSDQTATVQLQNGDAFTVTLRSRSEPNWDNWTTHVVDVQIPNGIRLPTEASRIASVQVNLVQDNPDWSADNWDIFSLSVYLFNPPFPNDSEPDLKLVGSSELQDASIGLIRLSKSAGPSGNGPNSPVYAVGPGGRCSAL